MASVPLPGCINCAVPHRLRDDLLTAYEIIAQLRRQIRDLTDAPNIPTYEGLRLTRQERAFVEVVRLADGIVTNEKVTTAVEIASNRGEPNPSIDLIQHRVNRKLAPHGVRIMSEKRVGKYLLALHRERLECLM